MSTRPQALRDKSNDELLRRELDLVEQLYKFRFQRATGALENPMKVREARKEIARIKTILRERAIEKERSAAQ